MEEPQEVDKKRVRTSRGQYHEHNKYNMTRYENSLEKEEGFDGDKAKMLCIKEALVGSGHINIEIKNDMTKK